MKSMPIKIPGGLPARAILDSERIFAPIFHHSVRAVNTRRALVRRAPIMKSMPIKIPGGLPARAILDSERIFALEKPEAERQRVRPLKMVILNLMPKKIETETQLLRLISKSPLQVEIDFMKTSTHESTQLQVEIDFMKTSTHESTHVSADHLVKFYEPLESFADNYYDGLIVTGAPVEHLSFEQVDYWDEFRRILDWAASHVFSTMYLCWGAMGALHHRYGVRKVDLDEKLFGVFPQFLQDEYCFLTNGFDEIPMGSTRLRCSRIRASPASKSAISRRALNCRC